MSQQKLYTEEQVRDMLEDMNYLSLRGIDYYMSEMTPIELSSDEEIEKQSEYIAHNYFDIHNTNHYQGLKEGSYRMAKWMRDKILTK